jgi:P27 family predicted phage terminase small subunit
MSRRPNPTPADEPGKPKPPPQVKGLALKEWKRVVPELMKRRTITPADAAALAMYCTTFARWQEAEDRVARDGLIVKTKSGNVIQHPALGIANTATKLCHRWAVELGLTPSSRSRAKPEEEDEDDAMEIPV